MLRRRYLDLSCALLLGCSSRTDGENVGNQSAAVVGGAKTPDELGFAIDRFQRNAALGALYPAGQQGCSGTLVGDRVVVSAAHCVVLNQDEWLGNGAAPEIITPSHLKWVVGDDVKNPTCLLQAASISVHPEAKGLPSGAIAHDVSITILDKSTIETCPDVVPVQINRDPITPEFIGRNLLQGGFGSLDYTYNFSPIRYWSLVEIVSIAEDYATWRTIQHGGASFGDSGSGHLYRFPDGSLRNLGPDSLGWGTLGTFVRLDQQGDFLDSVLTPELVCGTVGPNGICRGQAAIACGPTGFTSNDCAALQLECVIDADSKAACICACDTMAGCDTGCACDPDCKDAGTPESGADADGPDAQTGICKTASDLYDPGSCGPGQACDVIDFVVGSIGCRPSGSLAPYATCDPSMPPCPSASFCLALGEGAGLCAPYCDPKNPKCPTGGACAFSYGLAVGEVGFCLPPDNCDLSAGCAGGSCYQGIDPAATYCLGAGTSKAGQACESAYECAAKQDCFEGKCTRWCKSSADCTAPNTCEGIGTITGQPTLGHCKATVADGGESPLDGGIDSAQAAGGSGGEPAADAEALEDGGPAVTPPEADSSDGGCHLSSVSSRRPGSALLAIALAGLVLGWRQRGRQHAR